MLTEVAEGVLVHRSELLQNNTVVVRGTSGVLVVDAGISGSEMTCLANDLRELGQPAVAGFSTHPHWDHVLWHDALGDGPRYGTARCATAMQELRSKADWKDLVTAALPEELADDIPLDPFGLITALPTGTTQLPWDGPKVRIIEHTAHSPGHAGLLIVESGVLAAGDMLSDLFVPMLNNRKDTNDPIEEYLTGLQLLEAVAADVALVIPGHGSIGSGGEVRERIALDRAYVLALRDGGEFDDPRVTRPAKPGWEWVSAIHEGQAQQFAGRGDSPG